MNIEVNMGPRLDRTCPLGDLLDFRNDIVHPEDNPTGSSIFVGLEHIERDTGVRIGSERINLNEMTGRRARFRAGDIVYGYLRPYLNKVWIAEFDGICSVDQYVFVVRPGVDRNYVARFLRSAEFLKTAPIRSAPGQLPRIRSGEIAATPIPLPPLDEQRRIAAVLDKADVLRRKRKRALGLLKKLTQSIFAEMFGDALKESASNKKISLGEIFDFKNGVNFSSGDRGRGMPVVDVLNMYTDDIFASIGNLYRVDLNIRNDMILSEGDLLFVRSSVKREGVGWASLFPGSKEPMTHCGFIIRARPRLQKVTFRPHFLVHYLRLPEVRSRLIASAGQVAITNINQERLGGIEVPQVRLREQELFELIAKKIEKQVVLLKKQMADTEFLFSSLQSRAFSGQV
ncbi:restriction endonuclease subunit S [Bradyrhizobium sediminis]|uniref:Restriction endonuclease subunit S n=1 Tax=Bradyrhizobium sediminis TaxID=2840469 RepID=A0A975NDG3_9BRAD|nr:restriction endonuclease subunit S [Bradyrhizobium sediminis]QWG12800.1 restriction endonuclease subunit S [Bradyrhizobium sediminis]